MIRLIVSDIDGTLVEDGGNSLNPEVFDVIRELKDRGIHFAAASGRQAASIEYLFEPVREKLFYLGDNGAYVGCYGRNLFLTEMEHGTAMEMVADMKALGLDVLVGGAEYVYVDSENEDYIRWLSDGYHFRLKRVGDVREAAEPIIKVSACRRSGISHLVGPVMEKYRGRLKTTLSGSQWLDTMSLEVNKGNAVKLLQESLEIRPEETMAFGDQLNDIEMMGRAYYSFAVANAMPETKAAARFLADSNTGDGVLKVLKLLL